MDVVHRIVDLLLRPAAAWDRIAREPASVDEILRRYLLPLALLTPVSMVVGMIAFDRSWNPLYGYQVPREHIFASGAQTFVLILGIVIGLAGIFTLIVPLFGATRSYRRSMQVATYGAIPVLLAGGTLLLPMMAVLALLPVGYTVVLYWMGARRVLGVSRGVETEFLAVSFVLLCVAATLAGAAAKFLGLL